MLTSEFRWKIKTTKQILWKQLEKNLKEPYPQNILNLRMWENRTSLCHQQAQARAVLANFRLCQVEFRIRLKNQKITLNTTKFKIPN